MNLNYKDKEDLTFEMIKNGYGLPHTNWDKIWEKDNCTLRELKQYRNYLDGVIKILEGKYK